MNGRERIMAVLRHQSADCVPVWPFVMGFAARITHVPYGEYCTDHRALVRAQAETAQSFNLDAVTIDSDAYREAEACGAVIEFPQDSLPIMRRSAIEDRKQFRFRLPQIESSRRLWDKVEGVALANSRMKGENAVCGWVEAPFQSAAMLRGLEKLLMDLYDAPDFVEQLLDYCCELAIDFARAQYAAGADIIGMGDAAATMISPEVYERLVVPRLRRVVEALHAAGGLYLKYHICGSSLHLLPMLRDVGFDIITVDSMVGLADARACLGGSICLKGDLNPVTLLLNGTPEQVLEAARNACASTGGPLILSAGCEVPVNTPEENIHALVAAAHETGLQAR